MRPTLTLPAQPAPVEVEEAIRAQKARANLRIASRMLTAAQIRMANLLSEVKP